MTTTNSQKKQIHRQMTIEEILGMFPTKAQKLSYEITNAGLHCVGCHAATFETLEAGMLSHGKTEAQIDHLVERLNALLNEEEDPATISMTKKAADKFRQILEEDGKLGWSLRFGDQLAGCSGFEYVLDFSEKAEEDDDVFESHGLQIHVKKSQSKRLMGSQIDYIDGLHNAGFKISQSACEDILRLRQLA